MQCIQGIKRYLVYFLYKNDFYKSGSSQTLAAAFDDKMAVIPAKVM